MRGDDRRANVSAVPSLLALNHLSVALGGLPTLIPFAPGGILTLGLLPALLLLARQSGFAHGCSPILNSRRQRLGLAQPCGAVHRPRTGPVRQTRCPRASLVMVEKVGLTSASPATSTTMRTAAATAPVMMMRLDLDRRPSRSGRWASFQADRIPAVLSPAPRGKGAGLGLALVRQIAQPHGGDATVMPRPDAPASIVVELTGALDRRVPYGPDEGKRQPSRASGAAPPKFVLARASRK